MKIFVRAKTGASKEVVKKLDENHFIVSVTVRPIKGKANQAIIKALAKYFKVSQSKFFFSKGLSSKEKIIEVLE
jgi:hypothetical protein